MHYKCNVKGGRICLRDWYGPKCSKFCSNNDKKYACNEDGDKVCLKNWYGENCAKYCNNSATHFRCNDEGHKVCSKDWYGPDCLKFCDNNNKKFKCNTNGDKICMPNWYGKNCTVFCNNTAALSDGKNVRYFCNNNGQKTCIENRYGSQCNLHCTAVMAELSETNTGHEQSDIGLYYCEIEEGIEQENIRCPKGWKDTNCLQGCQDISEYVTKFKTKCDRKNGRTLLCSSNTIPKKECSWNDSPLGQTGEYLDLIVNKNNRKCNNFLPPVNFFRKEKNSGYNMPHDRNRLMLSKDTTEAGAHDISVFESSDLEGEGGEGEELKVYENFEKFFSLIKFFLLFFFHQQRSKKVRAMICQTLNFMAGYLAHSC